MSFISIAFVYHGIDFNLYERRWSVNNILRLFLNECYWQRSFPLSLALSQSNKDSAIKIEANFVIKNDPRDRGCIWFSQKNQKSIHSTENINNRLNSLWHWHRSSLFWKKKLLSCHSSFNVVVTIRALFIAIVFSHALWMCNMCVNNKAWLKFLYRSFVFVLHANE